MSGRPSFDELDGAAAGFITRLLAFLLDVLILTGVLAVGGWLFVAVDNLLSRTSLTLRLSSAAVFVVLTPVIIGGYFVVFWALSGRTIGKQLLGVRVVTGDGNAPGLGRALLRLVGYGLSMVAVWAGFLWIIIDNERRGWHDHIAGTWVVYDWGRRRRGDVYTKMTERS